MAQKQKTIILMNMRRIQPETKEALLDCQDGDIIGVLPEELDSIMPITFYGESMAEAVSASPVPSKGRAGRTPEGKKASRTASLLE